MLTRHLLEALDLHFIALRSTEKQSSDLHSPPAQRDETLHRESLQRLQYDVTRHYGVAADE